MLSYITWTVDPEIFSLGSKPIVWYGLCWAIGLLCAVLLVEKIYKHEKMPEKWFNTLFWYVVVGVIVGARLGHCLFYNPGYYLSNPIELFKIWEGGLASHGGAIGIVAGVYFYHRKTKQSMIWVLDRLIIAAALTGTFIRIGNLTNHEIYGHATDLPWAFRFITNIPAWQRGAEPLFSAPSHPTQIYEALIYFSIFCLTMFLYWKTSAKSKQGLLLGIGLIGIFLSRFLLEYLKNVQEPFEIHMRATFGMDMGQMLSIPFILWGIWLVWNALRRKERSK
ncbi:prolipoprotein diacylglyceryl transferase [Dysgonomonas sp. 520]|uniref:prolipoprotein diacylglyceryl transferase n=1 Tax=Dysgonomonas sp. 520 TaxID=2302931 RepID=UPI0013CFAF88|nr:prolipoprotein diacylglyceryl transferase [Dysgonomonas sp. 520]NDW08972.1 prolipoprotein diacylglyceryl transferase [Dysgonomonas sp. 520]